MAEHCGFFDSLLLNGEYDRTYSADDYCDNLATIIKTGVQYSPLDDLAVKPAGGMALSVGIGRAWINGRYYYNDSVHTGLVVPTAPTGSNKRIDRVVVRMDKTIAVRNIYLDLKVGTAAASPVPPTLTRDDNIYEIALADIYIDAAQTALDVTDIVDQRENENVCGWAACVTPAIISLLKEYKWRTELATPAQEVTFFIPQYEADSVHILEVYVNGIRETAGEDYTVQDDVISFALPKQAGTEIEVFLYKSIDGTGLKSVDDEVKEMQATLAALATDTADVYVCNGKNDNVLLSQIAQEWLNGGTDYASKKIRVVGTFGASAPYGGTGDSTTPYRWLSVGTDGNTNRRIIFDFSSCGEINLPVVAGKYNTVFYGHNAHIIGANVIANETTAETIIKCFSSYAGAIKAENCRFWVTAYRDSMIASTGTFENCRGSVANIINNSYCFLPFTDSLLRINGGEYYAYTGDSSKQSGVVGQSAANSVTVMNGVNAPTAARSGFYQTNSVLQWSGGGVLSCTDLVSALPLVVASGISNIRGTIAKSKAGLM